MKKGEVGSSKRATSIKNKIKHPAKKSITNSGLKLPEINMQNLVNMKPKTTSTRFQSQSPNPSRTKINIDNDNLHIYRKQKTNIVSKNLSMYTANNMPVVIHNESFTSSKTTLDTTGHKNVGYNS